MLEEKAAYRSQYVGGEIYAMAGTEPRHDIISNNLGGMFYLRFRGRDCTYHSADVKVRAKAGELWTYPDWSVLCGKPEYDTSARPHSLLNPQAIFEVLSPSTADFNRGEKFERYKRIGSLTDYVLVASEKMRVEHYIRQTGGDWLYREYHEGDSVLKLAGVDAQLPLAEIYERVTFPEPRPEG